MLEANQLILDTCLQTDVRGELDAHMQLSVQVQIGAGSTLVNCTIRGLVTIGQGCHLENGFIGPYRSLADHVTLIDVDLEHSVILQGARVVEIQQRIVDSVIGQRAHLKTAPQRPKALRFLIGDDPQIELT